MQTYGQVNVRMAGPAFKKLKSLAKSDSRSLAEYTRLIIMNHIKKEIKNADKNRLSKNQKL